jgi:hypothetical protein
MAGKKTVITGEVTIKGSQKRHQIVQTVVNTFINFEHNKKGKGIAFRYKVEGLPNGGELFIARPGHKKNFDFKVDVIKSFGIGEGSHKEIANDLRGKRQENPKKFVCLLDVLTEIYKCSENNIDKLLKLKKYIGLNKSFKNGAKTEFLLKIIKWLFIMEDIVYWDNEGRAFLFNFLRYAAMETDENRLKEALEKVKNPDRLKSFIRKSGIEWIPVED